MQVCQCSHYYAVAAVIIIVLLWSVYRPCKHQSVRNLATAKYGSFIAMYNAYLSQTAKGSYYVCGAMVLICVNYSLTIRAKLEATTQQKRCVPTPHGAPPPRTAAGNHARHIFWYVKYTHNRPQKWHTMQYQHTKFLAFPQCIRGQLLLYLPGGCNIRIAIKVQDTLYTRYWTLNCIEHFTHAYTK